MTNGGPFADELRDLAPRSRGGVPLREPRFQDREKPIRITGVRQDVLRAVQDRVGDDLLGEEPLLDARPPGAEDRPHRRVVRRLHVPLGVAEVGYGCPVVQSHAFGREQQAGGMRLLLDHVVVGDDRRPADIRKDLPQHVFRVPAVRAAHDGKREHTTQLREDRVELRVRTQPREVRLQLLARALQPYLVEMIRRTEGIVEIEDYRLQPWVGYKSGRHSGVGVIRVAAQCRNVRIQQYNAAAPAVPRGGSHTARLPVVAREGGRAPCLQAHVRFRWRAGRTVVEARTF
jgi:hypothetical protein